MPHRGRDSGKHQKGSAEQHKKAGGQAEVSETKTQQRGEEHRTHEREPHGKR